MLFRRKNTSLVLMAILSFSIISSLKLSAQAPYIFDIEIENDNETLNSYLKYSNSTQAIFTKPNLDNTRKDQTQSEKNFELNLVAEIEPPKIKEVPLQAISVSLEGKTAAITYGLAGEEHGGALDLINLQKAESPKLISRLKFNDLDVTHVLSSGNVIYATVSKNEETGLEPSAFLVSVPLKRNSIDEENIQFFALEGKSATSLYIESRNQLFVTTGEKGGLYSLKVRPELSIEASTLLDEARWVTKAGKKEEKICVLQGTPGKLTILNLKDDTFIVEKVFDVQIPDAQAKSSIFPVGENLLVASGTAGLQLLNIDSGKILGTLEIPEVDGLAKEDHATNHAIFEKDLIFIANGGAGITVAESSEKLEKISDKNVEFKILGTLRTDNISSINHLAIRNRTIVAAAGRGGVKILNYKD